MNSSNKNKKIYFDHSATTAVDPQVLEAMLPYFSASFGNASSVHSFGQEAKVALDESRRQIAAVINAEPSEIVFTSGGTEADNLAIQGTAQFFSDRKNHIVTSAVEHHAVLYACKYLEKNGYEVTYVPVDEFGMVSPEKVAERIREETCLVSIMHANNEIGTINPIREIAAFTKDRGVLFHTDAVQTFGKIPIDVKEMNIDMLSISSHKIYGPKGIGALYIRRGIQIEKLMHGGKHERDRRAGTENIPGAVGLGKASEICGSSMAADQEKLTELSADLRNKISETVPNVYLNGHDKQRLHGILNLSFAGVESDSLLLSLDLKGIAVSNGSACSSGTIEPSHVLKALKLSKNLTGSAIRFSLGRENTSEEVDFTVEALQEIVSRLRDLKRAKN